MNEVWRKKFNTEANFKTSESRAALKRMIELRPERNTSLIDITVYSDDKAEAALIANTVAEVYEQYRLENRKKLTSGGIEAFKQEVAEQDKLIKDKASLVDELRVKYDVTDTDPQSSAPGTTLGPMNVLHYDSVKIDNEGQYVKEKTMVDELKKLPPEKLRQALPTTKPRHHSWNIIAGFDCRGNQTCHPEKRFG